MKVIIARYKEDIGWVKDLRRPYIVINKGEEDDNPYFLPNYGGREANSFLHYLAHSYNKLDTWTAFLQGDPFPHCNQVLQKLNTFNLETVPIYVGLGSPCTESKERFLLIKNWFKNWGLHIQGHDFEGQDTYTFCAGAQMIIHRDKIQRYSQEDYYTMYEMTTTDTKNVQCAHHFERIWPYLFS